MKLLLKIPSRFAYVTLRNYLVPETDMFSKRVKQSGMKDSNCNVRFNHLKIIVEKVLLMVRRIL